MTPAKLGRQLKIADRAGVRFAVIAGEDERAAGAVTVKNLATGDQSLVALDDLVPLMKRHEDDR